jgi:hypothetical protein
MMKNKKTANESFAEALLVVARSRGWRPMTKEEEEAEVAALLGGER